MSAKSLKRRIAKVAATFTCPNCGFLLRGGSESSGHDLGEYRRFLSDATDEELAQIENAVKSIQKRHNQVCHERNLSPVVMYPMSGTDLQTDQEKGVR